MNGITHSMASKSDLSVCNSYKEFDKKLCYHRGNSKKLNDAVNKSLLDKHASSQLLRGSFTEVVATWEKYVQGILQEAVEIVFNIVLDADSAQAAITATQSSRELFKRAMVHHILDDSGRRRESTDDKVKSKKKVVNLTKREASTVELSVNLIVQPNLWKELLVTFKESLFKRYDRFSPLLHGEDGIDSKFKSLFDTNRCLSDIIIEMGPVEVSYIAKDKLNHSLAINSSQSLNDILRLYYGARCAFAHGQSDRTFKTGGALHNFPSKSEFQSQVGEVAGDYLYILYSYAKKYGSEAWIYYPTLLNLQRFMRAIAFRLFAAISKWVYDEFGICIWNFDPAKEVAKIDDSMDNDDLPPETSTSDNTSP